MGSKTFLYVFFFIIITLYHVQSFSSMTSRMISKSLDRRELPMVMSARLDDEDENVNVFEIKDVDAVNLVVVGFGAIAFNFFVLANMGDGGIGGIVARIINTWN